MLKLDEKRNLTAAWEASIALDEKISNSDETPIELFTLVDVPKRTLSSKNVTTPNLVHLTVENLDSP